MKKMRRKKIEGRKGSAEKNKGSQKPYIFKEQD